MTDHNDAPLEGRVYPAGQPVRRGPVMLPAHAPRPGEVPPWRDNPPPPRPEPVVDEPEGQADDEPEPDEGEQHTPEAPPEPQYILVKLAPGMDADDLDHPEDVGPPWWSRLADRVRPWHLLAGAALALVPTPTGYSAATTWANIVWHGHEEALWLGYTLAVVGVASAYRAERRCGNGMVRGVLVRAWTVCALVGVTGALDLWDPVQILTGVSR